MAAATIAIVGGGFCGTRAAIALLDAPAGAEPRRIVLVEAAVPGQGLAYRPGPDYWRLNVTASRVSVRRGPSCPQLRAVSVAR